MKKTLMSVAIGATLSLIGLNAQAAVTLTFANGGAASAVAGAPCSAIGWTAGNEFRMCNASNAALGIGGPKSVINGGETWAFNDAGQLTAVTGTPTNGGAAAGSAAPAAGTNVTLQQNAAVLGAPFNFLAPVLGSLAGTAYGPGAFLGGAPVNGTTTLARFNVLEAQYGGAYFPLGQDGGRGIDFTGVISGATTVGDVTTFNFELFASETINDSEDPGNQGFANFTAQWHLQGTGTHTAVVPVPAAAWLLGSGLVGLVGVARRRKTQA